jgi:GT2 family glycosyltransferase
MSDGSLLLSIIVVNWNTRVLLAQCLASIQNSLQDDFFEIIVVDNASSDGSLEMVQDRFPRVRLIKNDNNAGFARANNQAIQASRGQFILLLNSDAYFVDESAIRMVTIARENPDIGILGGNLFFPDGRPQSSHGELPSLPLEIRSLFGLDKSLEPAISKPEEAFVDSGYVNGACLMIRRACLDQIGLLDEGFFMFSEEIDWCIRAKKAGWRVCHAPDTHIVHQVGGSTAVPSGRVLMLYRGKLHYFAKHYGALAQLALYTAMWFATLSKLLIYSLLRGASLGRIKKDALWRSVARDLVKVSRTNTQESGI